MSLKQKTMIMLLFVSSAFTALSQNLNTPNKMGPLGTQVNIISGNLYIPRSDLYIPARGFGLNISFYYNSFNYNQNTGFGNGWGFGNCVKYKNDTANSKTISWGDGREDNYMTLPGGGYRSPKGFFNTLTEYQSNKYLLTELDGTKIYFDNSTHKKITRMEEPNGNYINFNYTDSLLTSLVNAAGQTISFTYNVAGRLATVVDAIAAPTRTWMYTYDGNGNLTQVTDPLGGTNKYSYLINGPMKTITDKNDNTVDIIYYPDYTTSELIGCNKRVSFSYNSTSHTTVATDHLRDGTNQFTKYEYQKFDEQLWLVKKTGACCDDKLTTDYDNQGNIIKQTDANGNVTAYTYDTRGNVITITDALGQVTSLTYSAAFNNIVSITDPKGHVRNMQYDSNGNLTQLTEPGGLITTAAYSPLGDIISLTDPKGNVMNFTYDSYGYPATLSAALGFTMSYIHDARGKILSTTDPRGFTYQSQFDVLDRLVSATDPAGHTIQRSYDAEGNLITTVNENGQTDHYFYDASNRVVKMTNAKGYQTLLAYNAMDKLISVKDALGNTGIFTYDNLNRLLTAKDALGNVTSFNYDANGNVISSSSPMGRVISYTYDNLNRLIKSEDETGILKMFVYDANGNVTSSTNGTGAVTTFQYDILDRLIKVTDPLGNQSSAVYDNNSNAVSITDRDNKTMNFVYDALNRQVSVTDNNGFITNYTYDIAGNITSAKDHNNNITLCTYDNLNRASTMTYPDGKHVQFVFDNINNLITKTLPDGNTINYQYDSLNRLISKTLPAGNVFSYTYDPLNRLTAATNSSGTISFAYDQLSRLIAESFNGKTTSYTYNVTARLHTITYPDSTTITKSFNKRGLLTGIIKNNTSIVNFQYNNDDQVTGVSYGNGITSGIQYDFANRVSTLNSGSIQNANYSFDKERNKTSIARNNLPSQSEEFNYDNSYRLTNYKKGPAGGPYNVQNTYNYDALGNRSSANLNGTTTTYTTNNLNQLMSSNNGSQIINFIYDNNGNLIYDGTFYKTYDAEGRVLSDSASPTNKLTYRYDALGRRVEKAVNGIAVKYTFSGLSQIEQRDANTDTLLNRSMFAGFVTPVMLEKNDSSFYYLPNQLNSVEAITNNNGALLERYDYDTYGKQTIYDAAGNVQPSSLIGNRFGFTGQETEKETGNVNFFYRQYSPSTGTFNQRDPLGYYDGMGLYRYSGNNPANKTDLLGLRQTDEMYNYRDEMNNNGSVSGVPKAGGHSTGGSKEASSMLDFYKKGANDVKNTLSALGLHEDFLGKGIDKMKITLSQFERGETALKIKDFLNNPYVQRLGAGLKLFFFVDKVMKTYKDWNHKCPVDKTIAVTEITISGYSLILALEKIGWIGKTGLKNIPILKAYGILDALSKLTTGKSILENTRDAANWHGDMMDKHPMLEQAEWASPAVAMTRSLGYLDGRYNVSNTIINTGSSIINSGMNAAGSIINSAMNSSGSVIPSPGHDYGPRY